MKYRSDVKTGVIFAASKNKAKGKEFVKFLLQEENLQPYVEGALGRWFPVTSDRRRKSPFWQSDRHRKTVYDQFTGGTPAVRLHQELQVHHPEQRERLGQGDEPGGERKGPGRQGSRRVDRRIKQVAG